jgi:polyhydroxyalkanoate synthesis regulator phasin
MLLKKNKISAREAASALKALRVRVERERKKERKVVGRRVDEAVQGALAAFNIPSRREVAELTRKIEELSKKIDSLKRRPASRRAA